jgi:hypothetical protein
VVININEKLIGNLMVGNGGGDLTEGRAKSQKWKMGFFLL